MSVRRVRIHTDRDGDPVAVDVVLPSGVSVGELLPAIVDMVDGRATPAATAHRWRLDRLTGSSVDESLSLTDNGIHDGELLTLGRARAPAPGVVRTVPCRAVADTPPPGGGAAVGIPATVCGCTTLLASVALASTAGSAQAAANLVVAAVGTCAAAAVTRANAYPTPSNLAVVALAAAAGFLVVPSAPAAPNVFLAAMAGFSASVLISRLSGRPSHLLTATAAGALLTALVTVVALPVDVVGVALATAAVALLTVAPRLSVLVARLGPDHRHDDVAERARWGHATLSGLVTGAAAGCATGCALVAAAATPAQEAVAFTALITSALLLRARTYAAQSRQIVLVTAGLASGAACLWTACLTHPGSLGALAAALVVVGLVAAAGPRLGAAAARLLDALEYAALAAVLPTACWLGGLYTRAGGLHPS